MANVLTTRVILDSPQQYIVRLMGLLDSDETAALKVDKSAIGVAADGVEADSLEFEAIRWNIQGISVVTLLYDHTTDDVAYRLSGAGYDEPGTGFGIVRNLSSTAGAVDPRSAGGTGDILLTTTGAGTTGSYDITIVLRKATS